MKPLKTQRGIKNQNQFVDFHFFSKSKKTYAVIIKEKNWQTNSKFKKKTKKH